jgi:hypothetical protein
MINWKNIKIDNNINFIYIIIYSNNLILLGKESKNGRINKTDANLYSEFYGDINNDESIPQATGRILFEKSMNIIIEPSEFEKLIIDNKVNYKIDNNNIIFLYKINYNEFQYIPSYFNRIYNYFFKCTTDSSMNTWNIDSCPIGYMDKSELRWFSYKDIIQEQNKIRKIFFRNLYQVYEFI